MSMKKYTFRHADATTTAVVAETEKDARCAAMIEKYGNRPDAVCPYAPNYAGFGLALISIERVQTVRKTSIRKK